MKLSRWIPSGHPPSNQPDVHQLRHLAINKSEEQKVIPYQVLTSLSFYKDDERQGRLFETWSGSFSD